MTAEETGCQRGDVHWVNFDPAVGGEILKRRPALILSNNAANRALNRMQVVPITSNVDRLYPSEAYVMVAGRAGKAMADQLTTVSKLRVGNYLGTVSAAEMEQVERAVRLQLGLR